MLEGEKSPKLILPACSLAVAFILLQPPTLTLLSQKFLHPPPSPLPPEHNITRLEVLHTTRRFLLTT